ncbi:MAG TPA: bifunctional glycosyltransferase/class I SAM-dependent methyltransferase [Gaiellaceae bacterium]|nr:bifunctional glycosyltransferase/class I SAM-dependent methyltransferase [Gaiellaceae bacterium]
MSRTRIGILVVAYNAATTLADVLERIPSSLRPPIEVVLVSDDHSADATFEKARVYGNEHGGVPVAAVRQRRNLGYGGNQKFGYRWLIERGIDVAVLLHGDGQYAPEALPDLLAPLLEGRADVVLGSRMLVPGGARAGGMPLYKFVGNKVLTRFQNRVSGLTLSEWHSGYRAFSLEALAEIPFEENSDGFDFDTEVLLQLYDSGARIVEVPIPTYYGDEICHVNGVEYARDVCLDVVRYWFARLGFGSLHLARASTEYEWKEAPDASHRIVLDAVEGVAPLPARILDLGCAGGLVAAELRRQGHHLVGVDAAPPRGTEGRVDTLVVADLDDGLPREVGEGGPFDVVLALDVLEHLREPASLLRELHDICTSDARVITSVPNLGHWYPRLRIALGRFDYDRRGILDATHLRFFTWRSFAAMVRRTGWQAEQRRLTGLPLEVLDRRRDVAGKGRLRATVGLLDRAGRASWPSLFAYQYVAVLRPDPAWGPVEEWVSLETEQLLT